MNRKNSSKKDNNVKNIVLGVKYTYYSNSTKHKYAYAQFGSTEQMLYYFEILIRTNPESLFKSHIIWCNIQYNTIFVHSEEEIINFFKTILFINSYNL